MKDGWCLNNSQGKSKIIILPLLMESRVQTDCWQTSLIDHTFYCSSDYWQWSNCAHARLHITSTTAFRWDYSFGVGYEIWMMLSLPSKQFPRLEQNHHLAFIDEESSPDRLLTNFLDWSHILLYFRLLTMIHLCSYAQLRFATTTGFSIAMVSLSQLQLSWVGIVFFFR